MREDKYTISVNILGQDFKGNLLKINTHPAYKCVIKSI